MTNEQYYELIKPYEDASRVLSTRLEILNHSLYGDRSDAGPIHNIQGRIKEKKSMESKLVRLGFTAGVTNARNHLQDIAGLRIICYFVEDIYNLTAALKKQSDLVIIKEKDYIRNAKPNGYRSYHIVLGIPVYFLDTMEYFPVEVQLRTMAMDFWASMEHRVCYKKQPRNRERLEQDFCRYARILEEIDAGPIHNIQGRIKEKKSMESKLVRLGFTAGVTNARNHLQDIAGLRIICYFVEDIYNLTAALKKQSDLVIIKEKDYIRNAKPNGYRSYHIVLGIPVYFLDTMEYFPVEVQLRTMAMDFWASMEHRVCYKKQPRNRERLEQDFCRYARILEEIEGEFETHNERRGSDGG